MYKFFFIAFGIATIIIFGSFAQADDAAFIKTVPVPKSRQAEDIKPVEDYLQSLTTAKAKFMQTAHNGAQLSGTFYLNRPGRLRFEYDDLDDFIVADSFFIYFYDSELGEQSNAPIGQTLADFLLRDEIKLSGDISVSDLRRGGGYLQVTVTQTDDPDAGALILGFTENPLSLKKWRVIDSIGNITEIALYDLETGLDLDKSLFIYHNPNKFEDNRFNE